MLRLTATNEHKLLLVGYVSNAAMTSAKQSTVLAAIRVLFCDGTAYQHLFRVAVQM